MKLDPKLQAKCDRCGKTTTKYVEPDALEGTDSEGAIAVVVAAGLHLHEVCEPCWAIILSCVTRAGKVQARTRK